MLALLAASTALRAPLSAPDSRPAVARRDLLAGFAVAVPVLAAVAPAAAYDSIEAAVRSVSSVIRSNTTLSRGCRWISDVVNAFMRR